MLLDLDKITFALFEFSIIVPLALLLVFASLLITSAYGATLTVLSTGGNASSPLLYGLMFEVLT